MKKAQFISAKVEKIENLGQGYFINWLSSPSLVKDFEPGQFLMIEAGQYLMRPFSVFDIKDDCIGILYKVIGSGTEYLSKVQEGHSLKLNGPLGKGFTLPSKDKTILIIAGGIGIAPFPFFIKQAVKEGFAIKVLYGARNVSDLVCLKEISSLCEINTITDDGSSGRKGFVTELLREELNKNLNCEVVVCGPTPMLNKAIDICEEYKLVAQVSFEEHMACGYGICMSCVVENKEGKYIRTCIEGPVIKSNLICTKN